MNGTSGNVPFPRAKSTWMISSLCTSAKDPQYTSLIGPLLAKSLRASKSSQAFNGRYFPCAFDPTEAPTWRSMGSCK